MTTSTAIRHEDGSLIEAMSDGWEIEEPCVCIPVSVIRSHDINTISEWLHHACDYAEMSAASQFGEWLLQCKPDGSVFDSDTNNINRLRTFAGKTQRIDTAIAYLDQLHEIARYRVEIKSYRREIASNRDTLFLEIGKRDGFGCQYCHATKDLTIDHIKPLIHGGTNDLANLQILCRTCNSRKSDK